MTREDQFLDYLIHFHLLLPCKLTEQSKMSGCKSQLAVNSLPWSRFYTEYWRDNWGLILDGIAFLVVFSMPYIPSYVQETWFPLHSHYLYQARSHFLLYPLSFLGGFLSRNIFTFDVNRGICGWNMKMHSDGLVLSVTLTCIRCHLRACQHTFLMRCFSVTQPRTFPEPSHSGASRGVSTAESFGF